MNAIKKLGEGIGIALDSRANYVATNGWVEDSSKNIFELAKSYEDTGIEVIIFTDIDKDGLMEGLSLDRTKALAERRETKTLSSQVCWVGLGCVAC